MKLIEVTAKTDAGKIQTLINSIHIRTVEDSPAGVLIGMSDGSEINITQDIGYVMNELTDQVRNEKLVQTIKKITDNEDHEKWDELMANVIKELTNP